MVYPLFIRTESYLHPDDDLAHCYIFQPTTIPGRYFRLILSLTLEFSIGEVFFGPRPTPYWNFDSLRRRRNGTTSIPWLNVNKVINTMYWHLYLVLAGRYLCRSLTHINSPTMAFSNPEQWRNFSFSTFSRQIIRVF